MGELLNKTLTQPTKAVNGSNDTLQRKVDSYNESQGPESAAKIYDCPICKNKGLIAIIKNNAFYTESCTCMKIRAIIRNLKNSGLGAVDKNTLDNYIAKDEWQKAVLNTAKSFINEPGDRWFFIGGQVGAGKTHIGKAIAYTFIQKGIPVQYMEWKKDVQELNSKINEPEYLECLNKFTNTPVLYIDDFLKSGTASAPTQGEINRAIDIIYQRYNQVGTTVIISSERTLSEIIALDEGAGSRIAERCAKEFEINIGKDANKNYRLQAK